MHARKALLAHLTTGGTAVEVRHDNNIITSPRYSYAMITALRSALPYPEQGSSTIFLTSMKVLRRGTTAPYNSSIPVRRYGAPAVVGAMYEAAVVLLGREQRTFTEVCTLLCGNVARECCPASRDFRTICCSLKYACVFHVLQSLPNADTASSYDYLSGRCVVETINDV